MGIFDWLVSIKRHQMDQSHITTQVTWQNVHSRKRGRLDVLGVTSATMTMTTVKESSTVMASAIFSPLSGGSRKTMMDTKTSMMQGNMIAAT
jgi:hypothetical protein